MVENHLPTVFGTSSNSMKRNSYERLNYRARCLVLCAALTLSCATAGVAIPTSGGSGELFPSWPKTYVKKKGAISLRLGFSIALPDAVTAETVRSEAAKRCAGIIEFLHGSAGKIENELGIRNLTFGTQSDPCIDNLTLDGANERSAKITTPFKSELSVAFSRLSPNLPPGLQRLIAVDARKHPSDVYRTKLDGIVSMSWNQEDPRRLTFVMFGNFQLMAKPDQDKHLEPVAERIPINAVQCVIGDAVWDAFFPALRRQLETQGLGTLLESKEYAYVKCSRSL